MWSTDFSENATRGSRVAPCGHTDDEANNRFPQMLRRPLNKVYLMYFAINNLQNILCRSFSDTS